MLECIGVGLKLGEREVLRDVNLALTPGRFVAVLGPNGAGKSSLIKILSGVLRPHAGEVRASGVPLHHWDRNALARRRAVLSQETLLTFNFRALEVVLMGRQPHHHGREARRDFTIAVEALHAVGAGTLAERHYLTLSGGEKQRVHLARALAQIWEPPDDGQPKRARCLLLDEPVNNLDLQHQHSSLRIAKRLCAEGVTVLAVLHDLNLAFEYADEWVLLAPGRAMTACPAQPEEAARVLTELFGWPLKLGVNPCTNKPCVFSRAS